jgi:hypothetical protein
VTTWRSRWSQAWLLRQMMADHAGLLLVAGVVGSVEREVPQRGELGLAVVRWGEKLSQMIAILVWGESRERG